MQSSSQPYGVLSFSKPTVEKGLPTIEICSADYKQHAIVLHEKNLSNYIQAFTNEEIDTICGSVILNAAEEVW